MIESPLPLPSGDHLWSPKGSPLNEEFEQVTTPSAFVSSMSGIDTSLVPGRTTLLVQRLEGLEHTLEAT